MYLIRRLPLKETLSSIQLSGTNVIRFTKIRLSVTQPAASKMLDTFPPELSSSYRETKLVPVGRCKLMFVNEKQELSRIGKTYEFWVGQDGYSSSSALKVCVHTCVC